MVKVNLLSETYLGRKEIILSNRSGSTKNFWRDSIERIWPEPDSAPMNSSKDPGNCVKQMLDLRCGAQLFVSHVSQILDYRGESASLRLRGLVWGSPENEGHPWLRTQASGSPVMFSHKLFNHLLPKCGSLCYFQTIRNMLSKNLET